MLEPCSEFKVDTSAEKFGTCLCGHSQAAHKATSINPAEAALRAMKAKNAAKSENAAKAVSREEEFDSNAENEVVTETSETVLKRDSEQESSADDKFAIGLNPDFPRRQGFGFGIGSCSVCKSLCRNRGCKETKQTICHRCWPKYVCENGRNVKSGKQISISSSLQLLGPSVCRIST
jgi:hypothetical protein